jgi:regulator of cell morphogenesis and NO signaling
MIAINPEATVGEIAAGQPLSVRVFEQLGIDYCCGGQSALRGACRAKGLDPADVLLKIQTAAEPAHPAAHPTEDWLAASLGSLTDHILATHHAYMKSQLPRLSGVLAKILVKHPRHKDVLRPLADIFGSM